MNIVDAVKYVREKFIYRTDPKILDYWTVMPERNGRMLGDCDDFAITAIWLTCDRNLFKFIVNVMLLHKYRFYFAKTRTGERHLVGYASGLYFDNWTKSALSKEEFLAKTGHKIYFFFPSPIMLLPLLSGFILRFRK